MGMLFLSYTTPFATNAPDEDADNEGQYDDDSSLFLSSAKARAQEILTVALDRRWGDIESLLGMYDDEQLLHWLLNAVAFDAHEAASELAQQRAKGLPSLRRRHR